MSQAVLADLAGCSRQYIAQLESGQRRAPSPRIVTAIANALQLRGPNRAHLYHLAGMSHLSERPDNWPELLEMARVVVTHVCYPAYVHDSMWRVWGFNRTAEEVFEISSESVQIGVTTLLDLIFHPSYRHHFVDWDHWVRVLLAEFRRDCRAVMALRENQETLRRLRRQPDFRRFWHSADPAPDSAATMALTFQSGSGAISRLRVVRMLYPGPADIWINVVVPAEDAIMD